VRAQHEGRLGGSSAQQRLDRAHCRDDFPLPGGRKPPEQRGDFVVGALLQRREGLAAFRREPEMRATRVVLRAGACEQAFLAKPPQDAAEVPRVQAQLAAELAGCGLVARNSWMCELIHHAHFSERIGALEEAALQHADPACIEPVEPANGGDSRFGRHGYILE